jgi:hypothetical protein
MGDWGIKISQDGVDVKTATAQQLIMSNAYNALKVKMVGTTAVAVAHGLAYKPIFWSMEKISATHYGIVGQNGWVYPYVTSTNFVPAAESKYYIFYQQGG